MAAVFAGFDSDSVGSVGGGWAASTSSFAVRQSSAALLKLWISTISSQWESKHLGSLENGDEHGNGQCLLFSSSSLYLMSSFFQR